MTNFTKKYQSNFFAAFVSCAMIIALPDLAGSLSANNNSQLDAGFGENGVVQLPEITPGTPCSARALALDDNSKIQAVTSCGAVSQFNGDGSLDTAFANNGVIAGTGYLDMIRLADGKILTLFPASLAWPRQGFGVKRHNSDGSIDTTFGVNGVAIVEFDPQSDFVTRYGYDVYPHDMTLDGQGRIVIAGSHNYYRYNGFTFDRSALAIAMARLNSDGSPDASFGVAGRVITDLVSDPEPSLSTVRESAASVAIHANGTITIAGTATVDAQSDQDLAIIRYLSDGSLDVSFGQGGVVLTDVNGDDTLYDLVLGADNSVIAVGQSDAGTYLDMLVDMVVVSIDASGNLNTAFGAGGVVSYDHAGFSDRATSVAQQADGKIVLGGITSDEIRVKGELKIESELTVIRINQDGSLDVAFGDNGVEITDLENVAYPFVNDLLIQSDGKILVAAQVLLRYLP